MKSNLIALLSGTLFSLGLIISGMIKPEKVLGFLDILGNWDPSLGAVMLGAILVHAPFFHGWIKKTKAPIFEKNFHLPNGKKIDKKLISGSILFGLGWALAGLCPGPALVSTAAGVNQALTFSLAMLAGMFIFQKVEALSHRHVSLKNKLHKVVV